MRQSVWRRVRARVHLSLTPFELSNPVHSATTKAFSSLLMRYSPELGGAVVAHIGPVELCGNPAFIDASPFAHVAAIANLLVFAPKKGTELLGVVTHVGPDHLGLSVLSAFHAVLPIDGLVDIYRFETKHNGATSTPMWERIDGSDHITVHRQLRFVISALKPTRTGLFQIIASLDPDLRHFPNDSYPLGLLPPDKEISQLSQSLQQRADSDGTENAEVLQVTKRSSTARAYEELRGNELLAAGNDGLGDALMPTSTSVSVLKKKKPRQVEKEGRSVSFKEAEGQMRDRGWQMEQSQPRQTAGYAAEINGSDVIDKKADMSVEKGEKSDRKKQKKDKKKKKKKKKSVSGDELSKSLPSTRKREAQTKEEGFEGQEFVSSTRNGDIGKDRKDGKKHRRKRKGVEEPSGTEEMADEAGAATVVVKMEDTREISMLRDADKAVELGPMTDEDKKKKKKKKRRRSTGGESEEHKSLKKRRKKRMSAALEMERRRSMQ